MSLAMIEPWAAVVPIAAVFGLFSVTSLTQCVNLPAGDDRQAVWGAIGLLAFIAGLFTIIITGLATS